MHNLLSNAIKFTHGGTVEILAGSDGNLYYLTVIDTGEGMSEEQVYALLHNNIDISNFGMDGKQGAGIGFLIVNDLVRATQGEISIDSIKGKGSKVTINWTQKE